MEHPANRAETDSGGIRRTIMEILLILLIPLILSIVYNLGSPRGIPLIPQKQTIETGRAGAEPPWTGQGTNGPAA